MKLEQWITGQIEAGCATGKKAAYRALAEAIRSKGGETVSALTIENTAGGKRLTKYEKAKAISEVTDGQVTIKELCE